jgi:DNA-binding CsgD family transcriptional regulator
MSFSVIFFKMFFVSCFFLCCLFLGIYVLLQDRKNRLNRLFFILCLFFALWEIGFFLGVESGSTSQLKFWMKVVAFFAVPSVALGYNIIIYVTQKRKLKKYEAVMIYLPAIFILAVIETRHSLLFDYQRVSGLWKMIPNYNSVYFYIMVLYCLVFVAVSIILIFLYGRNTVLKKEKKQAIGLIITILAGSSLVILKRFVLPFFHIYDFSEVGIDFIIIYVCGLYYSVFRNKIMIRRPFILADEIISNFGDMLILLDSGFRILSVNKPFGELLSAGENDFRNRPLDEIADIGDGFRTKMKDLMSGKTAQLSERLYFLGKNSKIAAEVHLSRVIDKSGDFIGILVIVRENYNIRQFMESYRISGRQYEIMGLAVSGLSNREIGEKLGLKRRTVENHLLAIYNKLSVNSRLEMMNFVIRLKIF